MMGEKGGCTLTGICALQGAHEMQWRSLKYLSVGLVNFECVNISTTFHQSLARGECSINVSYNYYYY